MPSLKWSRLNGLQLGRYGEYYAKMEMASYGLDIYTSEVDDHGIDFVMKNKFGCFFEVQVKSVRNGNYVFLRKDKFSIYQENLFLFLLLFNDKSLPETYLIPASAWKKENDLFKDKDYDGLKSKPEYGINLSKKNKHILEQYSCDVAIPEHILNEHI